MHLKVSEALIYLFHHSIFFASMPHARFEPLRKRYVASRQRQTVLSTELSGRKDTDNVVLKILCGMGHGPVFHDLEISNHLPNFCLNVLLKFDVKRFVNLARLEIGQLFTQGARRGHPCTLDTFLVSVWFSWRKKKEKKTYKAWYFALWFHSHIQTWITLSVELL